MIKSKTLSVQELVLAALVTAMIAVMSIIAIPMPFGVPVTLQTFGIALCGYLLGWKKGALSVFVYILMGAAGLPVFANLKSGLGTLFGMTGGFLFGFLLMVVLCGIRTKKPLTAMASGLAGLLLCHVSGVVQFAAVTDKPLWQAFLVASLPFILKDVVSVIAAYFAARLVKRSLRAAHFISFDEN